MCTLEFDRCYRLRNKIHPDINDLTPDDFCIKGSGCINNGYPPCTIDENFIQCLNSEYLMWQLKKPWEYEICKEYYDQAKSLGVDTTHLYPPQPYPMIGHKLLNPEELTPIYCIGKAVKIEEPRFDIFWGFEENFIVAEAQWKLRKQIYEDRIK